MNEASVVVAQSLHERGIGSRGAGRVAPRGAARPRAPRGPAIVAGGGRRVARRRGLGFGTVDRAGSGSSRPVGPPAPRRGGGRIGVVKLLRIADSITSRSHGPLGMAL